MRFSRTIAALSGLFLSLAHAASAEARDCARMAELDLPNVSITNVEAIPGGARWAFPPSPFNVFMGPNAATETAFCRVAGTIEQEIGFEVWLPPDWSRRMLGVGNAGLTGAINYPGLSMGIARGFATASTDTGHRTPDNFFDASWIPGHPDRVENFGWRAHHLLALTARRIRAYYGSDPYRSYFAGCSSGGWQGLTEAQQYPADYDGILAGAPANNFVRLQTRSFWLDSLSRQNPAGNLGPPQIALLIAAASAECDAADGVRDGIAGDPQACRFDPASLICPPGQIENCLTRDQADRARLIYGPARTPAGTELYPGNAYGVAPLVVIPGAGEEPALMLIVPPAERSWTAASFDPDRDIPALEVRLGETLNAWSPDLRRFRRAGGKLIVYHGWSDALLSPYNSIAYHQAVKAEMAPAEIGGFYRLFMVPGMDHCAGGPGTDRFDLLGALVEWVERDVAPERVVASGRTPAGGTRTRPLCPHPQVARYDGTGSSDDEGNFDCAAPGAPAG